MRLFISYRRDDTKDLAGRICDRLRDHFGRDNVFIDSGSISTGEKWRERLNDELNRCDALVAVIGDDWNEIRDAEGRRRIDDPADEVRREISAAFSRNVTVVPLLVENAKMPEQETLPDELKKLHERQWIEVRSDQYFDSDMKLLCQQMDALRSKNRRLLIAIAALTLALVAVFATIVIPRLFATPEASLAGTWEQSTMHQGQWESLGMLSVSVDDRNVIIKASDRDDIRAGYEVVGIEHKNFDGREWTFEATYRDGVIGYFRFARESNGLFLGTLKTTTLEEKESKHRLIRID